MIRSLTATALVITVLASGLGAQTVTTILNNGTTQTRYDMVILGDGYQVQEQGQFNADVTTFLASLFQTQPYQTFAAYYNVHTVFRASVDSGADHPDASPPIWRNTVYDASYNTGGTPRCLYIGNTSQALTDAALAPATEGRVLVMVNDSRYGGCGGTFSVSYNGTSMSQVQLHELGHSFGQLADEYDYPNTTYTGPEPGQVNVTTSPSGQKWSHWHGTGGISSSAYQGARYYQYGLYRPRSNCLMRSLGASLCAVCQENIARITNSICQTIYQTTPSIQTLALNIGQSQLFSFSHFVPAAHSPLIEWQVDGQTVPGASTTSHLLDTTGMALGVHTVTCSVEDRTTIVRQDPNQLMRHEHSWSVTITDPSLAQLHMPWLTINPILPTPGTSVTLSGTVLNDGPATATFDVEFFLTRTQPWSVNDVYLGSLTVTNLAALQQFAIQHQVSLPWQLETGLSFIYAVIDRANVVPESTETDNEAFGVILGQAGPCFTKLEFDDPLLYPLNAATVSSSNGGAVHPTVVAPCATPGTLYLIVWGCSGTVPGTTLAPGVTVPINQDFCTQLGLGALNGSWFQMFLGTLDGQGRGHATFNLPPNSGLWPSAGNFAAMLIDSSPMFSGVTNPIAITIGQ